MSTASVFFAVSFIGLASMIAARLKSMRTGQPGFLFFLSNYDVAVGNFLVRTAIFMRAFSALFRQQTVVFFRQSHHFVAEFMLLLVRMIERRARAWREFARERKIERGDASAFIQDVVDYKKELKQNGNQQDSRNV